MSILSVRTLYRIMTITLTAQNSTHETAIEDKPSPRRATPKHWTPNPKQKRDEKAHG